MTRRANNQGSTKNPLVSVVIPSYNRRGLVGETLESVLSQNWPELEVILVDDGSDDGTAAYVREQFSDAVTIHRQKNQGPSIARNTGLCKSHGDYLTTMDSDDIMPPESIKCRMESLLAHPKANAAYGGYIHEHKDGKSEQKKVAPKSEDQPWPKGDLLYKYALDPFFRHTDLLFERQLLPENGRLYPPKMAKNEDYIMVLKILARAWCVPCYRRTTHLRAVAGEERLRYCYDRILKTDIEAFDRAIAEDQVLSRRLEPIRAKIRARHLMGIANAARKIGDSHKFRQYFRKAREADPDSVRGFKAFRRYLLSFFHFSRNKG
ncbi:MAG: glycosyltransferase family 2 protein [Planctomycetes bacterium]|nr:glycosyltransferase family 2 protein [Planctomycetota bacterium]